MIPPYSVAPAQSMKLQSLISKHPKCKCFVYWVEKISADTTLSLLSIRYIIRFALRETHSMDTLLLVHQLTPKPVRQNQMQCLCIIEMK